MNSKLKTVLTAIFISASLISVGFYLANYYNQVRPNKESINKIGIKPDVEISDETKNETDEVLNQAILLLK